MVAFAAVLLSCLAGIGSAVAQAQQCDPNDPYGCSTTSTTGGTGSTTTETTTPTTARPPITCTASPLSAEPGVRVDVTVTNVPGGTSVDLRFNGDVVDSGSAPAGDPSDVALSVVVPAVPPASYTLIAVGADFQAECAAGGFAVVAATGVPRGDTGSGPGSLARTGIAVALLVAIGVALIVVGRVVLEAARRRRRAASRAVAKHRDPSTASR